MSPAWVSNPRPPAQQTEALPTDWTIVFCARSRPKREQKYTTKNFVEFRNHSPQLTTPQTLSLPDRHAYSMFLVVSVVKITYLPQWLPLFQYCRKRTDRIHDYFWLFHSGCFYNRVQGYMYFLSWSPDISWLPGFQYCRKRTDRWPGISSGVHFHQLQSFMALLTIFPIFPNL